MASILFGTTQSTTIFGEVDESWDDNLTIKDPGSTSSSINGILFPAIFASLIVLANIVSLASFCVEKRLRTYNNYFIMNLSILDLLIGLRLGISVAHTHLRYFPFSQNACKIISGFANAFTCASNFTVVVICVDRHRATYDPINHFMSRSKQKALLKNALPWLLGLAFWLPYVTVWEFVEGFDNGVHCLRRYARLALTQVITNVVLFFGPFLIIAVLYFRIFNKIKSIGNGNLEKKFAMKGQSAGANRSKVVENYSVDDISTISSATTDVELDSADICNETFDQPTSKKNADVLQRKVIMSRISFMFCLLRSISFFLNGEHC